MNLHNTHQPVTVTYRGIPVGTLTWDEEAHQWNAGAGRLFGSKRDARRYLVEQYLMDIN